MKKLQLFHRTIGTVTGVSAGTVTITVTIGDVKATKDINVTMYTLKRNCFMEMPQPHQKMLMIIIKRQTATLIHTLTVYKTVM